jgi:hypothetical protein
MVGGKGSDIRFNGRIKGLPPGRDGRPLKAAA